MAKKVSIEKQDPATHQEALDIVLRIKRGLAKKTSVTKLAVELTPHLQNLKAK